MAGNVADIPKEFFEVADVFIDVANKQAETWGVGRVAASHLFAAARYAAYNIAAGDPAILADRANAAATLVEQFRHMLEDNLDWYEAELEKLEPPRAG
jgi:hypothetical protein